jgi:heptosyltransferase-1
MPAPRILFVKLSSLGDVVHHLPAVTDLLRHSPDAHVGWAVEEAYTDLVKLHPAVAEVFPVNLRQLREHPFGPAQWRRLRALRSTLRSRPWDYVIDTQGLIKSGIVAGFARAPAFGFDAKSARERLAARFYDVRIAVPRRLHAVERNRRLVAGVFGYGLEPTVRYGVVPPTATPPWAPEGRYVVLLHAASHGAKRWPEERWIALARIVVADGYAVVLPGGSDTERAAGARIAAAVQGAMPAPATTLADAANLLSGAAGVVGVDTGLTHLAVALGRPTVGIYCATDPALTGLHGGSDAVNVGGPGRPPSVEAVAEAIGLRASAP